jgi:hypothetical protein
MIIQFGKGDESAYGKWEDNLNVFISRPYFKIVLKNGLGFYILNSFKFSFFPRIYGTFHKKFYEFGIHIAGWTFEVMWNRPLSEKV